MHVIDVIAHSGLGPAELHVRRTRNRSKIKVFIIVLRDSCYLNSSTVYQSQLRASPSCQPERLRGQRPVHKLCPRRAHSDHPWVQPAARWRAAVALGVARASHCILPKRTLGFSQAAVRVHPAGRPAHTQ